MKAKTFTKPEIILAAGGNATAIFSMPDRKSRLNYASIALSYMRKNPAIEQVGFLERNRHLEMSGGEFCGNASRAAAWIIAKTRGRKSGTLTVSGFPGRVRFRVRGSWVQCEFPNFPFRVRTVTILGGTRAQLVDLGGIFHIILPASLSTPRVRTQYRSLHRGIVQQLKLTKAPAVGVVWQKRDPRGVLRIIPIVWVRSVNTFFVETSCGSATMAALLVDGAQKKLIRQPSGGTITAERRGRQTLILASRMQRKKKKG